eukprot:TRINITY_DN110003_c0_g1_i1.p1 TRINITY_DN110003_c0_g1~~TRINITY_DN110003_c0_g1_i1.p1  ORF type:complete len:546 (-),score=112.11 TRINITY_DN110003_c0_g1_i1:41-1654(-)
MVVRLPSRMSKLDRAPCRASAAGCWLCRSSAFSCAIAATLASGTAAKSLQRMPRLEALEALAEPAADAYFDLAGQRALSGRTAGPIPVERVRDVSQEEFDERARFGQPFIVEDAGRGVDLVGVSCESFHQRFPRAKMRAEYTGGRDEKFISLGSKAWFQQDRTQRGDRAQGEHNAKEIFGDAATTAPYVWHVKDGGHEAPPDVRAAVQRAWQPPYFLHGAVNLREANESAEFWFHRRNGAVLAHADTYCIPAVSLQLAGRKKWRLMPHPAVTLSRDAPDPHDGGIYGTGLWQPVWEATVEEGEAIVFFPNTFHETFVPEEGNPQCTVATTFQFQLPVPARYFRAFLPTHAMSHLYYEGHCRDLWHSYATLRHPKAVQPTLDEARIASEQADLLRAADADGDRQLSLQELQAYLSGQELPVQRGGVPWPRWFFTEDYFYDWRPPSGREGKSLRRDMEAEILRARAEDTMAYMDCDPVDGVISSSELLAALKQWHAVHARDKETGELKARGSKKNKLQKVETRFAKMYSAGRSSARQEL